MRLLRVQHNGVLHLEEFRGDFTPRYAILSHTWLADQEEATFRDIVEGTGKSKVGYSKVRLCAEQAMKDNLQYSWVDTCCIDKSSSAELSEAINSMYSWYQKADVCYAYLAGTSSKADFLKDKWFTRGWTLQELIAPSSVKFFDTNWKEIGTKSNMSELLYGLTGIPVEVLMGDTGSASVAQKMSWAASRQTTRVEDRAYCLMGIFGIGMPLIYGEGELAFIRLQEHILKVYNDHSIFAWRSQEVKRQGLFAISPAAFEASRNIVRCTIFDNDVGPFNPGVGTINLRFISTKQRGSGLAILHCTETGRNDQLIAIHLNDTFTQTGGLRRVRQQDLETVEINELDMSHLPTRSIQIRGGFLKHRHSSQSVENILEGHSDWVNAVAFSPDGNQLASGSSDTTLRIWTVATGKQIQKLEGHSRYVGAIAYSPNGKLLASGSGDWTARMWEVATGRPVGQLQGHSGTVTAVSFSSDNEKLATASNDQTVRLWCTASGLQLLRLEGHDNYIRGISFAPTGMQLASASYDGTVRLWDTIKGKPTKQLRGHNGWVNAVNFSPDGNRLISASNDQTVILWETATGKLIHRFDNHNGKVSTAAFSPDGIHVASAAGDHLVRVWNTNTGKQIWQSKEYSALIRYVTFSRDSRQLALALSDWTIRLTSLLSVPF